MILASKSPRRLEILNFFVDNFQVQPAMGEERLPEGISPRDAVLLLSRQKAEEVSQKFPTETVIAADTVVAIDGKILGKPKSKQEAFDMLSLLSGRIHSVFTGVCIVGTDGRMKNFAEETKVEFYPLTDEEIFAYIATGDPMDKAGAYGIQQRGAALVKRIDGDFYNVMGLPIGRVVRELKE